MTVQNLLLVGVGGFLGSMARYATSMAVETRINSLFPFGTFTVNVVGSFLLGIIFGAIAQRAEASDSVRLFLVTGFCGGFTTFSAFAFENVRLLEQREPMMSMLYIGLSLLAGISFLLAGVWVAKTVF